MTSSLMSSAPSGVAQGAQPLDESRLRRDDAHVGGGRLGDDAGDLAAVLLEGRLGQREVVVGQHDRVGGGGSGDAGGVGQPERRDAGAGSSEQGVDVAVVAAGELDDLRASVAPRASRMALMVASVPELTSRTCSSGGPMRSTISSASSTSPGVGVPNDVPRAAASVSAPTTSGWA